MNLYMFVNVDWFFLSHRLPIAKEASSRGINMNVYSEFTSKHMSNAYGDFSMLESPIRRSSSNTISWFKEFYKTFMLIKSDRPDAVHAVTIKPIIFLGIICLILRIPFIASIAGLGPVFSSTGIYNKIRLLSVMIIYKIIFLPKKTKLICQSDHDKNILITNKLIIKDKIFMTLGSGVEIQKYNCDNKKELKDINILMASRLLPDKGVQEFCYAAGIIGKSNTDLKINFTLAGPIDYESHESLSEKTVTDICYKNNVEYIGNRNDLPSILAKTHIFVLPSYYSEGIPKVLLEAAASGCAIVTTDHPGCRDAIIPKETGLLVKPKDEDSLVQQLTYLISKPHLIESMGASGRVLAKKNFSVRKVIDIHFSIYKMFSIDK